jgi:hypothetical protein
MKGNIFSMENIYYQDYVAFSDNINKHKFMDFHENETKKLYMDMTETMYYLMMEKLHYAIKLMVYIRII